MNSSMNIAGYVSQAPRVVLSFVTMTYVSASTVYGDLYLLERAVIRITPVYFQSLSLD